MLNVVCLLSFLQYGHHMQGNENSTPIFCFERLPEFLMINEFCSRQSIIFCTNRRRKRNYCLVMSKSTLQITIISNLFKSKLKHAQHLHIMAIYRICNSLGFYTFFFSLCILNSNRVRCNKVNSINYIMIYWFQWDTFNGFHSFLSDEFFSSSLHTSLSLLWVFSRSMRCRRKVWKYTVNRQPLWIWMHPSMRKKTR